MNKLNRERRKFIVSMGYGLQKIKYRGKHIAFICSEGTIICSSTPSDWRESRNFRSAVRRLARQ